MDSLDNFRERCEAFEQRMEHLQQHTRTIERRRRRWCSLWRVAVVAALGLALALPLPVRAKTFQCGAGDVQCLIDATNTANANGEANTITLEAGTYTLTKADNGTGFDHTGLPVISSLLTIRGARAGTTIIEREVSAEGFRLLKVAATGTLTLEGLTLRNGGTHVFSFVDFGGAIYNVTGTVTLINCILSHNTAQFSGGIENDTGTVTLINSTLVANDGSSGDGGIHNSGGTLTLTNSTVANNRGDYTGGIVNFGGTVALTNSTVANNRGDFDGGGIVSFGGTVAITNSTIVANVTEDTRGGGIAGGLVTLQNTIVALNRQILPGAAPRAGDCFGSITSLGTNLIGDPTGCTITLQPSDLTGDPGLDDFTDAGTPGQGHFPLLPGSPAIDRGSEAACTASAPTDQLDTPRNGRCDIGAIEFYPVVNNLVTLRETELVTAFDPTPVPGGPAGTFQITATFENTSAQTLGHPFSAVTELSGGNLLLNADGGPGGVGARLTPPGSASTPFPPGATATFQFVIGLQTTAPFTFFLDLFGSPEAPQAAALAQQ